MQGQVTGNQGTYVDICCDITDLLASSQHTAAPLLTTLASGLSPPVATSSTSAAPSSRGKGKKPVRAQNKQASRKQATATEPSNSTVPCGSARGALTLTAMLLRQPGRGIDASLRGHPDLPELHQALTASATAIIADLDAEDAASELQLTARLAVLCSALAHATPDPATAAENLAERAHAHAAACSTLAAVLPPPQSEQQQQQQLLETAVALAEALPEDAPVAAKRRRTAPAGTCMAAAALAAANAAVVDMAMATNVLLDVLDDASEGIDALQRAGEAVESLWEAVVDLSHRFLVLCVKVPMVTADDGLQPLQRALVAAVVTMADSMEALCRGAPSPFV